MPDDGNLRAQSELDPLLDRISAVIAQAHRLLKEPMPDTFLGRKTQEPFPKEDD